MFVSCFIYEVYCGINLLHNYFELLYFVVDLFTITISPFYFWWGGDQCDYKPYQKRNTTFIKRHKNGVKALSGDLFVPFFLYIYFCMLFFINLFKNYKMLLDLVSACCPVCVIELIFQSAGRGRAWLSEQRSGASPRISPVLPPSAHEDAAAAGRLSPH